MMDDATLLFRGTARPFQLSPYLTIEEALSKNISDVFDVKFLYDGGDATTFSDLTFNIVGGAHDGRVQLMNIAGPHRPALEYRAAYYLTNAKLMTVDNKKYIYDTPQSGLFRLEGPEAEELAASTI